MAEGGIGRTEVMIGLAVAAVLALITLPLMMGTSDDALRAEVPLNVNGIRIAENALKDAFGDYVSAAPAPRKPEEVNGTPVQWQSNRGFDKLAWVPENKEEVYGSYSVEATADGFTVKGTCDTDNDGRRASFTATAADEAKQTSADDVF